MEQGETEVIHRGNPHRTVMALTAGMALTMMMALEILRMAALVVAVEPEGSSAAPEDKESTGEMVPQVAMAGPGATVAM